MKSRVLLSGFGIASLCMTISCKTPVIAPKANKNTSQLHEFRRLKPGHVEAIQGFELNAVERLGGDPVEYRATNEYYQWQQDYPVPHLNVVFPSLTAEQFKALKKTYGFGLSRVKYKAGEAYTLADFLMPFMQATMNHEFEPEVQEDYTRIASNCWGTGYEIVRTSIGNTDGGGRGDLSGSVILFYADTAEMQAVLQDNSRSQRMGRGNSIEQIYDQALQSTTPIDFGDIFLVLSSKGDLEHVLTYVDRDVWFEKVGYAGGSPYRLTTTKDFYHKMQDGRVVEWRRFPRGGLPDPSELFKTIRIIEPAPGGTTRILDEPVAGPLTRREVKFTFDAMGRAGLEASAYRPAGRPTP